MSHKFPRRKPRDGHTVDVDEANEGFEIIYEEIDGNLTEDNFLTNSWTLASQMDPGAVIQFQHAAEAVDLDMENVHGSGTAYPPGATPSGTIHIVENSTSWSVVDGMTKTFTTSNSLLWIMVSFQVHSISVGYQPNFAIRVDGTIIPESVQGGLERANDRTGEGTSCFANARVCECIINVPPGEHTVELVGKVERDEDFSLFTSGIDYTQVFNRELICMVIDPASSDTISAAPTWTPFEEDDPITATAFNTATSGLVTTINDLGRGHVAEGALNAKHLPSLVIVAGKDGMGQAAVGVGTHTNLYADWNNNTIGDPGWKIAVDGNANQLTHLFDPITPSADVAGALIMFDIHVVGITSGDWNSGYYFIVALQVLVDNTTWTTIGKTERYCTEHYTGTTWLGAYQNVPCRTLITAADISGTTIDGARVVFAQIDSTSGTPTVHDWTTQQGTISTVALHSELS